jgi:hypothetical protein
MLKKLTSIKTCHLAMMFLLIIATIISLIIAGINNNTTNFEGYFGSFTFGPYLLGIISIAALCCGIIYLLNDYSKKASVYYKAFLLLTATGSIINSYACYTYRGFGLSTALFFIKVMILVTMTFWDDLGKRNTWIIVAILTGIDLFIAFTGNPNENLTYKLVFLFYKLITDGTIALAVQGKYADKEKRGTE